jgi:dienelactone hydrolase
MRRSNLALAVVAAFIVSVTSGHALESSMTARSPLSPGELWSKLGDFCAMTAWDSIVERCELSADGKQRTVVLFGGIGRGVAALEDWVNVNRSFSWTIVSGRASVANYHAKVSVIADGQTSALTWTASYEANGVSAANARMIIEGTMYRMLCVGSPLQCSSEPGAVTAAELVRFDGRSLGATPLTLRGYLRRPDGAGPFPAVILLHGCNGSPESLDRDWGPRIAGWGYVTLTIDRLGPRGLKNTCRPGTTPLDMAFDAYQALDFLVQQRFVDPARVGVVGFSQGGWLGLSSVERGATEQASANKFRAVAAFYPPCSAIKGPMTVPTLILIGESDDWTAADACRKLADGQDDLGVSRQKGDGPPVRLIVYPDAYHAFDIASLQTPVSYFGHHLEFNKSATDQSIDALRAFLQSMLEVRR